MIFKSLSESHSSFFIVICKCQDPSHVPESAKAVMYSSDGKHISNIFDTLADRRYSSSLTSIEDKFSSR